jgi:SAM-dependent methyltransferase
MADSDTEHYDNEYRRTSDELYAEIRRAAFGEEIGQYSWLTAAEYRTFFGRVGIDASSHVLEVASGSGGPALFMAEETGCRVTGADIHEAGVAAANARAAQRGLADRASFVCADAREPLPCSRAAAPWASSSSHRPASTSNSCVTRGSRTSASRT